MLPCDEDVEVKFPKCEHVNRFVCFNGTVTKAFKSIVLEYSQRYVCIKCGLEFNNDIDYGHQDLMVKPVKCAKPNCDSNKFKCIELDSKLIR